MKRPIFVLLVALLAFGAALAGSRFYAAKSRHEMALDSMPELEWLRKELRLSGKQYESVARLHAEYRPECHRLCDKISAARSRVQAAAEKENRLTPELEEALREQAKIQAECQRAMVGHIYQTAALLDEGRAARYLELVLPPTLEFYGPPNSR